MDDLLRSWILEHSDTPFAGRRVCRAGDAEGIDRGRHRFRMEYRPAMYDTGRWISLAALALFLALCVAAAVRRRRK